MTTLSCLEHANQLGKTAKVALIEAGKEGERCGASRYVSLSRTSIFGVYTLKCSSQMDTSFLSTRRWYAMSRCYLQSLVLS